MTVTIIEGIGFFTRTVSQSKTMSVAGQPALGLQDQVKFPIVIGDPKTGYLNFFSKLV